MEILSFNGKVSSWIMVPLVILIWITALFIVKRVFFKAIHKFAKHTKTHLDDIFVKAADFPLTLLIFTSAGMILERILPLATHAQLTTYFVVAFKAAAIIAIILFVDRFLNGLIYEYSHKIDILKTSGGVARGLVRILVIGLGVLILLDSFGVSVTPVIASLGIGSLAVALALQPTLENFFAGIQIVIDKPIQPGQFIKLDSGEEGYVHKIGWRSTWIRLLANNIVVLPNKNLVNSKIMNYDYPDREIAVVVEAGVHYDSDLEHVEKVTVEVAKETLRAVPGAVQEFEPFIRYHTFDDFSIHFSVILRAKEFVDSFLIKHEFIKRLHQRYAKERIVIPYPIRAINYAQEKSIEAAS